MTSTGPAEKTIAGLHASLVPLVSSVPRGAPILDVGCGTGAWLNRLSNLGFTDLQGIDTDPAVFACQCAGFNKLDLDHETIDLGSKRFGLITAIEVIEHLENPGHLWDLASRYLADDGRFLITTPNIQSLRCRLRFLLTGDLPFFDKKSDPTHIQPMYLDGAARAMARHGLEVERSWTFPVSGSLVFRKGIVRFGRALGVVLPDNVPGDVVCVLIRRDNS
jgi:2-polyprenyl-3-methyl-5-hydroxy-6-metoxy-1,4-benzoquinol methylase